MPATPEQDINRLERPRFTVGTAPVVAPPADVPLFRGGEPSGEQVGLLRGRIARGEFPSFATGLPKLPKTAVKKQPPKSDDLFPILGKKISIGFQIPGPSEIGLGLIGLLGRMKAGQWLPVKSAILCEGLTGKKRKDCLKRNARTAIENVLLQTLVRFPVKIPSGTLFELGGAILKAIPGGRRPNLRLVPPPPRPVVTGKAPPLIPGAEAQASPAPAPPTQKPPPPAKIPVLPAEILAPEPALPLEVRPKPAQKPLPRREVLPGQTPKIQDFPSVSPKKGPGTTIRPSATPKPSPGPVRPPAWQTWLERVAFVGAGVAIRALERPVSRPVVRQTASLVDAIAKGPSISGFIQGRISPRLQAQQATQRKCKEVKRKRKRTKCQSGYYVEKRGKTEYTPWREFNCLTGKTIQEFDT